MARRSNTTEPPGRRARRRQAAAKKRLIKTPRLKGGKKGLSTTELAQQFSAWLAKLKARLDVARASLEMLDADEVRQRSAQLDAIRDDLNVDLKALSLTDGEQRQVDKFREDLKAAHEVVWRHGERHALNRFAVQLEREAFLIWVQCHQLKQALEQPDQFPDVLKAGLNHIQDNLAAGAFLAGSTSGHIDFCRKALDRVLQSDLPLDRGLRERMRAMLCEPEERWEIPWSSRQLIPKTRPHPKTKKGEKPGPRPDPIKKMHIVEFVRRRHIRQGEPITRAVEAASAHFGKSTRYIFELWEVDREILARVDRELELSKAHQADKDQ